LHGIVHRDIKPENFVLGLGPNSNKVFLVDFGLAHFYRDPKTGHHNLFKGGLKLVGTLRYASVNAHRGIDQTRRDDLESLGNSLVYLIKGVLPWQGIMGNKLKDRIQKIFSAKVSCEVSELCEGLPREFADYMKYCKGLKFQETPDYSKLKRFFSKLRNHLEPHIKMEYDWNIIDPNAIAVSKENTCNQVQYEESKHLAENRVDSNVSLIASLGMQRHRSSQSTSDFTKFSRPIPRMESKISINDKPCPPVPRQNSGDYDSNQMEEKANNEAIPYEQHIVITKKTIVNNAYHNCFDNTKRKDIFNRRYSQNDLKLHSLKFSTDSLYQVIQ